MKKLWRGAFCLLLLIPLIQVPASKTQAAEDSKTTEMNLADQESKYEKEKTDDLQNLLDKVLGQGKAIGFVDVVLDRETKVTVQAAKEKKNERKKKIGEVDYLLPGVPNPKSVAQENAPGESKEQSGSAEETKTEVRTVIKKILATVLHDEKVPQASLTAVKDAITVSLKIDEKRGDKIEFKKTKFTLGFWEEIMKPTTLIPLVIALFLLFFLFGPVSGFLSSYIRTIKEKGGTEVTIDSKFEGSPNEEGKDGAGGGEGGALTEAQKKEEEEMEKKYKPFEYINEENIKRLMIYLKRKGSPQIIALVISYLKPEFAQEILKVLPPEMQVKVAMDMATIRQMTQEQVMAIDMDLKEKIDFLIGGIDHLLKVLDQVDYTTSKNILEYLRSDQPELFETVRKFIFMFDDIPTFPDQAMQVLIRELKSESLAKALRNSPPEIMNKFLTNMSANAAVVLKEEMEYGKPLSPEEIEEERKKILDTIKQLETDGKVFIREKPKGMLLEGMDGGDSEDSVPAVSDDTYGEYYNTGAQYYEAGQYEEALTYFEYCASLKKNDPALYQYLGGAYYALGRNDEAVASYQKALELDPSNEDLKAWLTAQTVR